MKLRLLFVLFAVLRVSGFEAHVQPITTPAGPGSLVPRVTAGNNSMYLSWIEPSAAGQAFRFASWQGGRWSTVHTIADSSEIMAEESSEPGVVQLPDGTLVAQWLTKAKEKEANHIVVAVSRDDGKTWSKPVIPYRDSTPGEHMYVSLFPWPAGGTGIVWLDPRGGKSTSLIQTTIDGKGHLGMERQIDADVCSCCPTSSAITSDGPMILYRGHTPEDIRDMHVTLLRQGVWQPASLVHADHWKINGCPTNSGMLSAKGQEVAAAWFTAGTGRKRVELAFSQDAGRSFSEPVTVDDSSPMGRASVALLVDGAAITTWMGKDSQGGALMARRVDSRSTMGPSLKIARVGAGQRFGFPFVAVSGDQAMVVWSVSEGEKSRGIRAALVVPLDH